MFNNKCLMNRDIFIILKLSYENVGKYSTFLWEDEAIDVLGNFCNFFSSRTRQYCINLSYNHNTSYFFLLVSQARLSALFVVFSLCLFCFLPSSSLFLFYFLHFFFIFCVHFPFPVVFKILTYSR